MTTTLGASISADAGKSRTAVLPDTLIQATDFVEAHTRPDNMGTFYKELEFDNVADEQIAVYDADGVVATRPAVCLAAETDAERRQAEAALADAEEQRSAQEVERREAYHVLAPYVRRPRATKKLYYVRLVALVSGDVAAVSGAALKLGEDHVAAYGQAFASATAAIVLGSVGREVRYAVARRQRATDDPERLNELGRFAHRFSTSSGSGGLVNAVAGAALAGLLLIGGGIFALRSGVEGTLAGIVFGCLALAVGIASFMNSFDAADDIAELLDNYDGSLRHDREHAATAAAHPALRRHARAVSEARSVHDESEARGRAAAARVLSAKYGALSGNPGVAGHGYPPRKPLDLTVPRDGQGSARVLRMPDGEE